ARVLKSTAYSASLGGTPLYMAPEAFYGVRSEQNDIWSAGVIFYQLLTGRVPYPKEDILELRVALATSDPDPLPSSIPEPIQEVVTPIGRTSVAATSGFGW